jgi:hypothetical protein
MARGQTPGQPQEERCSFLKKRTKKLFSPGSELPFAPSEISKSFLLLFFKKEDLPATSLRP